MCCLFSCVPFAITCGKNADSLFAHAMKIISSSNTTQSTYRGNRVGQSFLRTLKEEKAVRIFKEIADQGQAQAQYKLGQIFASGLITIYQTHNIDDF